MCSRSKQIETNYAFLSFPLCLCPLDSADRGVRRCDHRLPPGCVLNLFHVAQRRGPEGARAAEGVRDTSDGHVGHGLHHQLCRHHDSQHAL